MKKASILIILFAAFSCTAQVKSKMQQCRLYVDSANYYTLLEQKNLLKRQNDTLRHNLYLSKCHNIALMKYIGIVCKNPSQLVFLKGWANREMRR